MSSERYEPSMFAQVMRPRCPHCEGRLNWYQLGPAVQALGNEAVTELLTQAGQSISTSHDDLEFWQCRRCDEFAMLASPAGFSNPGHRPAGEPARKRSGGGSTAGGRRRR